MELLENTNALLVSDPTNIRYLTGFVGLPAQAGVAEREAYVLVTKDKTFLFTNSLYIEQAKALKNITVIQISRENPLSKQLRILCDDLVITKLGLEPVNLTVAEFSKLKKVLAGITFIETINRVEKLRAIKRADEIANIILATKLTKQCFSYLEKRIRPGITEARLAMELEGYIRARGGELAFPPIVAFNEHSSLPHYMGRGYNPLRNNSLVLLDFGTKINGYCADMTRVVFVGTPKPEWKKAHDVVLAAQQKAIDLLKDGVRSGATLDAAAKEIIAEANLPPYPHSLGHNIGLAVHESPRLSDKKDQPLLPGMVFSIEPGVYVEGQYGIRIEDLVRLTDTGVEVL